MKLMLRISLLVWIFGMAFTLRDFVVKNEAVAEVVSVKDLKHQSYTVSKVQFKTDNGTQESFYYTRDPIKLGDYVSILYIIDEPSIIQKSRRFQGLMMHLLIIFSVIFMYKFEARKPKFLHAEN